MKIYKIAGIPPPPPRLLKAIIQAINNFNKSKNNEQSLKIPIDLTNWEYGDNEMLEISKQKMIEPWKSFPPEQAAKILKCDPNDLDAQIEEMTNNASKYLRLNLFKKEPSSNSNVLGAPSQNKPANFMPRLGIFSILTTAYPHLLKKHIEHELIHFAQGLFERIHGNYGFMPKNKIRDKNDQLRPSTMTQYYMHDPEFQPLVHDIVYDFHKYLENIDIDVDANTEKENALNRFVQTNNALMDLKQYNPGKYQEILKELYKSIF